MPKNALTANRTTLVDNRMIAIMRLILASSALIIIYIDPTEPHQMVALTYGVMIAYTLYSAALYFFVARKADYPDSFSLWANWIDVACYLLLIALSGATSSIFFFFFFFAILVASFKGGFTAGLQVVLVSSIIFTAIGLLTALAGAEIEMSRFLLRPVYLLVLGYMMAFWGGQEITLKKRLALLKDVNTLSNPRFGTDRTIGLFIERLRSFFDADTCLLVSRDPSGNTGLWREANREQSVNPSSIEETEAAIPLFDLPKDFAVLYKSRSNRWSGTERCDVFDTAMGKRVDSLEFNCNVLVDLLDADYFISVPLYRREVIVNRLYLTSKRDVFELSDITFLLQVLEQVIPAIENVQILDQLASDAAEQQRQKISRDIHDTVIQPYIGIKLGLEALEMKSDTEAVSKADIERLINIADSSISDLRGYISKLRGKTNEQEGSILISAIKQQAAKFEEFYGIKVDVSSKDGFLINDRLAAEVFQIVTEGLSNIKRHTNAKHSVINLLIDGENLFLEIENDNDEKNKSKEIFVPKSIFGRVEALGGSSNVVQNNGSTKVSIEIPL
jgi:signal transduction histidine kinase